jgi:hypothetical protein
LSSIPVPQCLTVLQAFQTLMTLHVLFAPGSPIAEEVEGEDETTALALSLDDETQYRCAGFVQAEIERYAEHLATLQPEKDAGGEESGSGSDTEGEAPKPKKKGRKKKTVLAPEEPVSDSEFVLSGPSIRWADGPCRPSAGGTAGGVSVHPAGVLVLAGGRHELDWDPAQRCAAGALWSPRRHV